MDVVRGNIGQFLIMIFLRAITAAFNALSIYVYHEQIATVGVVRGTLASF